MKKILGITSILVMLCAGLVKAESRYSTDVLTGVMITSPNSVSYIHSGNNFIVGITSTSLAVNTTAQFLIDAVNITSYTLHVDFAIDITSRSSCLVEVYENSGFLSSGTATTPINLNRESIKILPTGYKIYTLPAGNKTTGSILYRFLATEGTNKNDFNGTELEISVARTKNLLISITPLNDTVGISMRVIMQALKQ